MVIIIAECAEVAQVEEHVASTGAEDRTLQISTAEPSTVKFVPVVVTSEAAIVTILKVLVTTSASKEPAADPVLALSKMVSAFTETVHTIIERGSGSVSTELAPVMYIIEELAHQMVQQFFTSMKSYIELVHSGSSFEFA